MSIPVSNVFSGLPDIDERDVVDEGVPEHFPPLVSGPATRPVGPSPWVKAPKTVQPAVEVKPVGVVASPVGLPQRKRLIRVRIPAIRITPPEGDTPVVVSASVPVVPAVSGLVLNTPVPAGVFPDPPATCAEEKAVEGHVSVDPPADEGVLVGSPAFPVPPAAVVLREGDVSGVFTFEPVVEVIDLYEEIVNTSNWRDTKTASSSEGDAPLGSPAPKRLRRDNDSLPAPVIPGRRPSRKAINSEELESSLFLNVIPGNTGLPALTLKPSSLEGNVSVSTFVAGAGKYS
jgi:hypothetical protein